jgi:disulfide bond formation protein DsbB
MIPAPISASSLGLALGVLAAALLAAAFAFEHWAGLAPCALCWWQRYAWMMALPPALAAAGLRGRAAALALGLAALAVLAGAGIALFHVGVEQGYWAGTPECGSRLGQAASPEERLRQIMAAPVVRCDQIAWSWLGLSMAAWNGLAALGSGGLALAVALRHMLSGTIDDRHAPAS